MTEGERGCGVDRPAAKDMSVSLPLPNVSLRLSSWIFLMIQAGGQLLVGGAFVVSRPGNTHADVARGEGGK
jgi:hypothetical protein